jgi:hypothetical protein
MAWNGGKLDAVVTGKQLAAQQRSAIVEDVERGFSDTLRAPPWQTDTCLGNWHYDRPLFERHGYKSAGSVITRLCDVQRVEILGTNQALEFVRDAGGLTITSPQRPLGRDAYAFRILGNGLV